MWRLTVVVPAEAVPAVEGALSEVAEAVLAFEIEDGPEAGRWRLDGLTETPPDAAQRALLATLSGLPEDAFAVSQEAPRDWLAETARAFPPFSVAGFHIRGSHVAVPPAGRRRLMVDAATAFGSGEHETTAGCLEALAGLARAWPGGAPRVLDLGCGSGILAMAAARCWPGVVNAVDIDAEAVRVAAINARLNHLGPRLRVARADSPARPAVRRHGPYDLILANILARPLIALAPAVSAALAPGGRLVLAGLLAEQERAVRAAYRARGLVLARRRRRGRWTILELRHPLRRHP
ncbi:ribosomal protein L11 methyltransferase [Roseospirillum parvum]|uniref:Ribosomal protein L11 methyltransferase n=1 Tax=Roseospirillum parvum TaxID=83401 RepID=A0A1G8C1B0_9PROT|nr:ribosomal protein L11 methyltransferase [Roseospirillum parvum]